MHFSARAKRQCQLYLFCLLLVACGVNPVTHKREFQFVSEPEEIAIGAKNYSPARQSQGGDYTLDPELTAYIQSVGNKLAAVSDRKLPYEFVVLNDSVPNAWAMPGGKVAFNRGLLYELHSEAELAAVLGHEITHAAARHGAQGMERGLLLQGAVLAVGLASQDSNYSNLIVGGSQLGAQLVSTKYGRDAESEADHYGMRYMKRAGYDPAAAVTLQETFVRLSQGKESGFLQGLFASHPPSPERVAANKVTLAAVGAGGDWGKEIYQEKTKQLMATKPAYLAYDEGAKALAKGDMQKAVELAKKAIAIEPREAHFHELLGDVAMAKKKPQEALGFYEQAMKLQPNYFKTQLQMGMALYQLGRKDEAAQYLNKSNALLPTAPSHFMLGEIAESKGDTADALSHYQVAADSKSDVGKQSTQRFFRLDMPQHANKYLQAAVDADGFGQVYAVVKNPTPIAVGRVQVRVIQYDPNTGRAVGQSAPMLITSGIAPNATGNVAVNGVRVRNRNELGLYRVVVLDAEVLK